MTETTDEQTQETLKGGRRDPVRFSEEICAEICLRMENGESLSKICRDEHMPAKGTVAKWAKAYEEFGKQYARAREDLLLHWADQIVDIATRLKPTRPRWRWQSCRSKAASGR